VEVNGVLQTTRDLGIGFVPYSPLGRGFLTGTITRPEDLSEDDGRRSWPRFQPEALRENLAIADAVRTIAEGIEASPAQVAIAWLMAQGPDVVPIPGARKVHHLEDNYQALKLVLQQTTIDELDAAAPIGAAVGDRYPAPLMTTLDG
jgi:aryl-alcohol dehydrogenase-like predicted oxidoreductase